MVVNERASKIDAPAARVWELVSTAEGQRLAGRGFVGEMAFTGAGLGMVRRMRTQGHLGDGVVVERCDHFDDAAMEMTYRIVDTGGIVPFADYRGAAKVIPAGDGASVLLLRSTFIPVDMGEEEAKRLSEMNFALFFDNVKAVVAEAA
ncbi:SRPBCC family protein [Rhizorhabdus wittichii]|uniref:SRPBCC family protein n=1 Tax=Rhizorhabdus wittichii TaxID=160791 RepID=A0A975D132_9SPHN|nr:SRPBCC family protein [Rhizorhabdus wittichii]QTH20734.1 SRPBCC family protein [Rhizorhabdus wittichii]